MEVQLLLHGDKISLQAHKTIEDKIAKMKTAAERYEDEPDPKTPNDPLKGEGKSNSRRGPKISRINVTARATKM